MGSVFGPIRFLLPVCRLCWFLYTLNIYAHFLSATIDGRNLIFRHNLHIGSQYCGKCFWTRQIPVCRLSWLLYTFNIYMHIFRRIILSNYWWQEYDIWSQASYMYAILWEAFLDPSDSYFLFADLVGFYAHWTYMHIFLSNYWWQKSDIWSQASYRYPISWEAFLDPSHSYFLFGFLYTLNIYVGVS